jgi:hypothetical protein
MNKVSNQARQRLRFIIQKISAIEGYDRRTTSRFPLVMTLIALIDSYFSSIIEADN